MPCFDHILRLTRPITFPVGNDGDSAVRGSGLTVARAPFASCLASVAIAAAIALAGCDTDGTTQIPGRAMAPLSQDMKAEIVRKQMPDESPILVRIFKEEAELEVWKQDNTGRFALLKTYPICRWSGDLGPKVKEGDRQAPEGFYQITPGLMNPNSNYYLAFNLGFPNAYDRANDRTGAFLMVHGDCSSRGCYAMTDEQIGEIFALGRDSFQGGQKSFQVQAYPFRMTPLNMAKHRNSPHMAFWRMIKQGYDHFEVTRQEPQGRRLREALCVRCGIAQRRAAELQSARPLPGLSARPEVAQALKASRRRTSSSSPNMSRATRRPRRSAPASTAACIRRSSPSSSRRSCSTACSQQPRSSARSRARWATTSIRRQTPT